MNKKGFTLVELLAVIVILALLALLTGTAITKVVSDSKEELYNAQILSIKTAAESWGAENILQLPSDGECSYLTLQDLTDYGLLDSNINNPKTNEQFSDNLKIKITSSLSEYNKLVTTYEVDPKSVVGCTELYPKVCTLATDADSSETVTKGDMITCTLGEDTDNFYVVENDGSNIQMLTELNLDTTTYQQSSSAGYIEFSSTNYWSSGSYSPAGDSSYDYVYDSNSNLYRIVEGYVNYLKSNGVSGASGKLLSYEQSIALGCSADDLICSSALTWVYTTSYWLGSASDTNHLWTVYWDGSFFYDDAFSNDDCGVRPVITISTSQLESDSDSKYACNVVSGGLDTTGSVIKCGTEQFYVIPQDEENHPVSNNTVSMLAMYNLNVEDEYLENNNEDYGSTYYTSIYPNALVGTQNKNVDGENYGRVAFFQGTPYWDTTQSIGTFIYDETQPGIGSYVIAYENYLNNILDVSTAQATLLSYDQMLELGCDEDWSCSSAVDFIYTTGAYYTGSFYTGNGIINVTSENSWTVDGNPVRGVRPVVIVNRAEIEE